MLLYQALGEKTILETEDGTLDDGYTMRQTIGTCGPVAFLFCRATSGHTELRLVPLHKVKSLSISWEWEVVQG
jgi:hypothetical protein